MRWIVVVSTLVLSLLCTPFLYGQVLHFGAKAGAQLSWVSNDDNSFRDIVKVRPQPGFNAGLVAAFKVKERFYLHTEYLYSTKGKRNKGRHDGMLSDNIVYNFIEVPMLYNVHFRGTIGPRQYKWYVGAGPLFSYWLGGRGTVINNEYAENDFPPTDYRIRFGERSEDDISGDVYMNDVKRLQLGVNIGGGIMLEPINGRKVLADLRFELGHSWMGQPHSADYVLPLTYRDNLKARNMGLRLSLMYLLEHNTDKKVRNKGKSTIRNKGRTVQRRK